LHIPDSMASRPLIARSDNVPLCGGARLGLCLLLAWLSAACFPCTEAAFAQAPTAAPARGDILTELGLRPDAESVGQYIGRFLPSDDNKLTAQKLIANLGGPRFGDRQRATEQLANLPWLPLAELEKAAAGGSAEVRSRARRAIELWRQRGHDGRLARVLAEVERRRIRGLAPVLLQALEHWGDAFRQRSVRRALAATVTAQDRPLLQAGLGSASAAVRRGAVEALARLLGDSAAQMLLAKRGDPDDGVRLAAARELANLGRREALSTLVGLLESESAAVRHRSGQVLRAATGQSYGFIAHVDQEVAQKAVQQWRKWVERHGPTAKLAFPLKLPPPELGRILICAWPHRLIELEGETGRERVLAANFRYLWGCQGLPDGRRLAVDYRLRLLVEYAADGRLLRREKLPGRPTSVERLADGNTLIALADENRLIELSPTGKIAWSLDLPGRPTVAQRLPNGNTIVNLHSAREVVEIDRRGKVVWRLTGLKRPLTMQHLANGNTLVCEMSENAVIEYDRAGNEIWRVAGLANPAQAQRLADGDTLVSDSEGLHRFNPQGKKVWQFKTARCRFHYY